MDWGVIFSIFLLGWQEMENRNKSRSTSALCLCILGFLSLRASAEIIQIAQGFSDTGDAVIFKSQLTIANDLLTVQLFNISPTASNSPDDLLSSYYFDIQNSDGQRPDLIFLSAFGDVYKTSKNSIDTLETAAANLKAQNKNDNTWQYLPMNPAFNPFLGFGVGTVGNSDLNHNNFNGNIVGGMDFSIFAGEITTQSLHNRLLVKNSATFTFSGLTGFTEADIKSSAFGLGTSPDSMLIYDHFDIPEPATIVLLCFGILLFTKR